MAQPGPAGAKSKRQRTLSFHQNPSWHQATGPDHYRAGCTELMEEMASADLKCPRCPLGNLGPVPMLPLCPGDPKEEASPFKSLWPVTCPLLAAPPALLFRPGAAGSWEGEAKPVCFCTSPEVPL